MERSNTDKKASGNACDPRGGCIRAGSEGMSHQLDRTLQQTEDHVVLYDEYAKKAYTRELLNQIMIECGMAIKEKKDGLDLVSLTAFGERMFWQGRRVGISRARIVFIGYKMNKRYTIGSFKTFLSSISLTKPDDIAFELNEAKFGG